MTRYTLVALLCAIPALGLGLTKRVSNGDFFDPAQGGGSWLDSGNGTLGEPLNVRRPL